MEISNREIKSELFERQKSVIKHSPDEVFVIKEVFPNGELGKMSLNSNYQILEADGQILTRLGYGNNAEVLGRSFYDIFAPKEKMRLNCFFEKSSLYQLSLLSYLQLRNVKKADNWVGLYGKQIKLDHNEVGYKIVFLDTEDSFVTLTTDKFDTLYRSFYEMHESELSHIGLSLRDDIAQELYALRVNLQNFIITHGYDVEISSVKKRLNDTIKKITDLSEDLLPNVFVNIGLLAAMEDMVFNIKRMGYDILYKIDARIVNKSPELQFSCYRIIQALFHAWKNNSTPYKASLSIMVKGNKLIISLKESVSRAEDSIHHYSEALLHNIRNRIALYDGSLEINQNLDDSQILITLYN